MNEFLVFQTEQAALAALDTIYNNMVQAINSPNLLDVATGEVVPKDELSPDQTVQVNSGDRHFPIFGINAATGAKDATQGYTTAWAEARQSAQGQWVFQKPIDSLLEGVTGYTVKPYDPTWFPEMSLQ